MLSSWVGLNALLYFGLQSLSGPAWMPGSVIAGVHIMALVCLYRAIKVVFSQMGFNRILDALGAPTPAEEGEAS